MANGVKIPLHREFCGGILSTDETEIYYVNVIDFLTSYGASKKVEHYVRTMVFGGSISCVEPTHYAKRFRSVTK